MEIKAKDAAMAKKLVAASCRSVDVLAGNQLSLYITAG
jgi:hypothetical protein